MTKVTKPIAGVKRFDQNYYFGLEIVNFNRDISLKLDSIMSRLDNVAQVKNQVVINKQNGQILTQNQQV